MKNAPVLATSLIALALASCAPGHDDGSDEAPGPRPGYELAKSKEDGAPASTAVVSTLDVAELRALIDANQVMLIDVRTAEEFLQGHIAGAINVPVDRLDPLHLPGSGAREVVLYCRSDRRSGIAARRYVEALGRPMRHLAGGILAWQEAGEPVAQS